MKCVLLHHSETKEGTKQSAEPQAKKNSDYELAHLVSQISINTSPKEQAVEKTLGGPFTFIGQYEEQGIIAMALRPESISESAKSPPANEHVLQPPLHDVKGIVGDILLMKVRSDEADEDTEFFLDLTREEYIDFASRTDIVAPEEKSDGEDETEGENGEEEELEEEYEGEDDSDDEEVEEAEMFETIMGHLVSRFEQQHGRAPNAAELLHMRQALAQKLGEDVALISDEEDQE